MLRSTTTTTIATILGTLVLVVVADCGTYLFINGLVEGQRPSTIGLSLLVAAIVVLVTALRLLSSNLVFVAAASLSVILLAGIVFGSSDAAPFTDAGYWPGPRGFAHRLAFGSTAVLTALAWIELVIRQLATRDA